MVTSVARLLESGSEWQCKFHLHLSDTSAQGMSGNVLGLSAGSTTLSLTCRPCDTLVSFMFQLSVHMIKCTF